MSLLNVFLEGAPFDKAVIAVDTQGVTEAGSPKMLSKLLTIPSLNAVIAMRGSNAFLANVFHVCVLRAFDSFDALLGELPGILQFCDVTLPAHFRDPRFLDTELVAVGWSIKESRMVAHLFSKRGDAHDFTEKETLGFVAPFVAEMNRSQATADRVGELARAQVNYMQRTAGIGGGTLVLCTVTRDRVDIKHVMTLQNEPEAACRPSAL